MNSIAAAEMPPTDLDSPGPVSSSLPAPIRRAAPPPMRLTAPVLSNVDLPLSRAVCGDDLRKAMAATTIAWIFGNVWVVATSNASITQFAKSLGANPFQFGLLSALPYLASLLSLPAVMLIERTGQRRRIFFFGLYFQRGLWIAIGLLPVWMISQFGWAARGESLTVFLLLILLMHAGNAVGGPAWVSWMADVIPGRTRGKYFARRRQWSLLLAIPAAWFVGWLLDHKAAQGDAGQTMFWCAMVFVAAAFFGLADIALFHMVPDVNKTPRTGAQLFAALKEPLHNKQYLWFAGYIATLMFAFVPMGQFLTLYALEKVELKNSGVQMMFLVVPMLAQLIILPAWGKAADRMGKKPLLVVATLGLVPVGVGWSLLSTGNIWLGFVLAAAGTALWTGVEIANFNLVLEFSGNTVQANGSGAKTGGSAYHAVNSVILNAAAVLGGLTWGAIAQWLKDWHWTPVSGSKTFTSYDVLFVLSGVLRLAAVVVFLPHIKEPKARPTREALRFMGSNIYNNLFNAVLGPLRMIRPRRGQTYEAKGAMRRAA